jgi:hypothetical protein
LRQGIWKSQKIQTNQKETHPMKSIKKSIAALALAALMLPILPVTAMAQVAEEKGPFAKYVDCANGCINKFDAWTWGRSFCAADCYIKLLEDLKDVALA